MNNFVLLYRFDTQEQEQQFEESIKKAFLRHKVEMNGPFKYFGFAGRAEPEVVDIVSSILVSMGMGRDRDFGPRNYVALYFSREKDPDNIKRQLLIGTEDMVDKEAETTSTDAHQSSIQNLLVFDYAKAMPSQSNS
ncbi:hypothetical protein POKO110462_22975 [Pontibacter korlensis]|uniref:Uncharacterized protein n=1 Tax=Pontibacter korlensis TaxID=400092 RepID=A0A0E3UYR0_9BACT|nr:hypothetical protein [Pontibacter korlensis]AKD04661.1 hypothetical protein PKOR_18120 [Pontibacter korlensis]